MTDLLPCPNCGGKAEVKNRIGLVLGCPNCRLWLEGLSAWPMTLGELDAAFEKLETLWNNLPRANCQKCFDQFKDIFSILSSGLQELQKSILSAWAVLPYGTR